MRRRHAVKRPRPITLLEILSVILLCLLIAPPTPVTAQETLRAPLPTPPPAEVIDQLERGVDAFQQGAEVITDAAATFGTTFVLVVLVLVSIIIIALIVGLLIWVVLRPSLKIQSDQSHDARVSRDKMTEALERLNTTSDRYQEVVTENTGVMKGVKTSYEASLKGSERLVDAVQKHIQSIDDSRTDMQRWLGIGEGQKPMSQHITDTGKATNDKIDELINILKSMMFTSPQEMPRLQHAIRVAEEAKATDSSSGLPAIKPDNPSGVIE